MRGRSWLFVAMSAVAVVAVLIGFGRTYAAPLARGTLAVPPAVHLHGALTAAWVLLFALQPLLARWGKLHWHRRIGRVGLPLAVGIAISMIPAGLFQVNRDLAGGGGPAAVSGLLGVFTSGVMFVLLVTAGILTRRDRHAHARWMLLATLVLIWPAWFRFRHWFPSVPSPEIWFALVLADIWIIVAILHDHLTRKAIHPVLKWAGPAIILEQTLELILFDTPVWRAAAATLYAAFHQ